MEILKYVKWFLISLAIVTFMACSSGNDGDDSSTNYPEGSIKNILVKENKQMDIFVSQTLLYKEGMDETKQAFETAIPGINDLINDGFDLSGDELVDILGEAEAENLINKLQYIENSKILPAKNAAEKAHSEIMSYEDKLNELTSRNIQSTSMQELLNKRTFNQEIVVTERGVFLTAAGILSILVTGYICHDEMQKVYDDCMAERSNQDQVAAMLECNKQRFLVQGPDCIKNVAVSVYTSAVGVAAGGFKVLQFGLDYASGLDLGLKIKELVGTDGCDPDDRGRSLAISKIFIGKGENSTFLVPEGKWTFVAFGDDMVREVTECIDITGDEDSIKYDITLTSIEEIEDIGGDENDDDSDSTSFIYYKPTQSECENGGGVWIGAINECSGSWYKAMNICELPSIEMWRDVIAGCGGVLNHNDDNYENSAYVQCYQDLGYDMIDYWSSSTDAVISTEAWVFDFLWGSDIPYPKTYELGIYIRCVR